MEKTFNFAKPILALASALLVSSCAHQISYPLMQSEKWNRSHISGSLRVEPFRDASPKDQRVDVKIGNQYWRVNGRDGYPGGQISPGVTRMVAKHIRHSGLFDSVKQSGPADYVLRGTIADYNASGQVNLGAEKKLAFGNTASVPGSAIAGVATRNERTQVSSVVRLSNVRLTKEGNGRTVWSRGSVGSRSSQRSVHFLQSDPSVLYRRADWELKRTVSKMVEGMGRSSAATR